jgi:hypothetical protein
MRFLSMIRVDECEVRQLDGPEFGSEAAGAVS